MEILVFDTAQEASQKAFEIFKESLEGGAKVFGLATGGTPEPLYELLSQSDLDFSQSVAVNLDEYYGLEASHPQSYHYFMNHHLFQHKPFKASHLPDGTQTDNQAEIDRYNQVLVENPIDLQLLGIGSNGHIGFNEPGTSFDSQTQLVSLTQSTIEANKRYFDSVEDVPTQAYSMGIASVMASKKILLLAFGEGKAKAIFDTIEGPVTEDVPASILQQHPNTIVLLDKEAAKLLTK